jgi:hypothetical protein
MSTVAPRTPEFSGGLVPPAGPSVSPGLQASGALFDSQVPSKLQLSVLDAGQAVPSQSGYSVKDYERVTPGGELQSPNGMSPDTWRTLNTTQFATHI